MAKSKSRVKSFLEPRRWTESSGSLLDGERFIKDVKPGTYVQATELPQFPSPPMKVVYHTAGSTMVENASSRTIVYTDHETGELGAIDVSGSIARRVSRDTIVKCLSEDEAHALLNERKTSRATTREVERRPLTDEGAVIRGGRASLKHLDELAKARAKVLIQENKLKYVEIRDLIAEELKYGGWTKSISWISNIAFNMRKNGEM